MIDEHSNLFSYNLKTQKLISQESNVKSVAWHSEMSDMVAFGGDGELFIKTGDLPLTSQKMPGTVVGFKGSKLFLLQSGQMNAIDVPQSSTFYRYLEDKNFDMCYKIACLGATESDWRSLGTEALKSFLFDMA